MKKEKEPASLYILYDGFKNVQHIRTATNGMDGFLQFVREDATEILQQGRNPNV